MKTTNTQEKREGNTVVVWPSRAGKVLALALGILWGGGALANNEPAPPMKLVVKWEEPSDTLFLRRLRSEEQLCCTFSFTTVRTDSGGKGVEIHVESAAGTPLGTIWGPVSPSFLSMITPQMEMLRWDLEENPNRRKGGRTTVMVRD